MLQVTADELPRLMACNGSRLMEGFTSSIVMDDFDRQEGIAAHWLIEQVRRKVHGTDELIGQKAPNGVFITAEMVENVTPYLEAIGYRGSIEADTSFSDGVGKWRVNARADHVEFTEGVLTVRDFKYGWSITEPEKNWTLIAHAIGYSIQLVHQNNINLMRDVRAIKLVIHQPRPYHFSGKVREWVIDADQLIKYHRRLDTVLSAPNDDLNTGSHCRKCPAIVNCAAHRKAQMNVIDESERAFTDTLDNASLSFMLDNLKRAQEVLKQAHDAYSDLATHRLREGQIVQGYSVQNDLTNKVWKDFVTPELALTMTGIDVSKKQLLTPNQAEKAGVPKEVIESMCERRSKGFKLVRVDADKLANKLFN